jgi:hypothetical protein
LDFNGLSIEQAPPISAPLRFFVTAPLFGILAGVIFLFGSSDILINRYSMDVIVAVHLITIGFFGFVMLGALTQMLPVLAGANIFKVKSVASLSHAMLSGGIVSMAYGLLMSSSMFIWLAMLLLGSGFLMLILSMLYAIKSVEHFTASIKGMFVSLVFAFFIVLMGIYLLYGYGSDSITRIHYIVANIHSVWAIFGFAGILIIGVAFQVLPMFYVAPRFKQFCKRRVVYLITFGLVIWMFLNLYFEEYALYAKLWIVTFFWAFATTVWIKFNKRKRPISDVTVWYWRLASISLTFGSFLWVFDEFFNHHYIVMVGVLIGGGFILGIMLGMIYKIVPFLVWFHLNGMGYMSIPTMNEMMNKSISRIQFLLFVFSLLGFIASYYTEFFLVPSSIAFILSMVLLEYNILLALKIYVQTRKKAPDFDMSAFNME